MSFVSHHVERKTRKSTSFKQINQIIDWHPIEKEIEKIHKRGVSVDSLSYYPGLLLLKIMLLQRSLHVIPIGICKEFVKKHGSKFG